MLQKGMMSVSTPENNTTQVQGPVEQSVPPIQPSIPSPPQQEDRGALSGGELFVGLNLLSKIGVIFIIIGVIAFAAVSEEYIPGVARTILVFVLGLVMLIAGEVFFRRSSRIFARALTLGGIAELFVSILIGYLGFETFGEAVSLIIAVPITVAGYFLSIRYNSQTILCVAFLSTFLSYIPAGSHEDVIWFGLVYLIVCQAVAMVICHKKDWQIAPYIGLAYALTASIAAFLSADEVLGHLDDGINVICAVVAILSFSVYSAYTLYRSFIRTGELTAGEMILLITSVAMSALMSLIFMCGISVMAAGIVLLILLAVYVLIMVAAKMYSGDSSLSLAMENVVLVLAIPVIFTLFKGRYAYMVFHTFAAALMIIGVCSRRTLFRGWGYATLIFSELYFLFACVMNNYMDIFAWQFLVNAVLWLAIMVVKAVKGDRSVAFSVYSGAALTNSGILLCYLAAKLSAVIVDSGALSVKQGDLLAVVLAAAAWMVLGFVAGKLKFMETGSPVSSLFLYFIGLCVLFAQNVQVGVSVESARIPFVIFITVFVNAVSVLCVLDMALQVKSFAPKFSRAVGLVVSAYALYSLTMVLGTNDWVAFTSCIISVIYILMAAAWLFFGFRGRNALLRRFGLALALFSSAKLFLFDFSNIGPMGRTVMFIGFGVALLCISFVYGYFEIKLKRDNNQ